MADLNTSGELVSFLARNPPFDELDAAELAALVASATEVDYQAGQAALVEDGTPTPGLWAILAGSMELVHEGEVIQVLEPGECFGHPSLLTGMAPAFTVRARERSRCLLFGADASRRALGTVAGARFVAATMRGRLTRAGQTVHGLHEVGTTPVSAIMRAPQFIDPEASVREACRRLSDPSTSALLVDLGEGSLGIVTDSDLTAGLAGETTTLDAPVRSIAHTPVPIVPPGQLAIEATVDMLSAGTGHVAVRDGERVCGILSAGDLLELDAHSPIALRHAILSAADEEALVRAAERLREVFLLLARAGVPARDLGRVLTLQHDAAVARLIDFSIARSGPAPLGWAWLDLGSAARREFTLGSDQDNALAYGDPPQGKEAAVDAYFERLGRDVNDGLVLCGIGVDNNGVLAGNRPWRMSRTDWLRTFGQVLAEPDESRLIRAAVSFDFRTPAGGLVITPELTERIREARRHGQFMRLMARTAMGYHVALSFRGQLAIGRDGDPPDRLDLKRGAIIPIVNLVRFHALAAGVTISPTLDRIEAVMREGGLMHGEGDALREAFEVITRVRFAHHADLIAAGAPADNMIDPGALTPIARTDLREALNLVKRAQKRLGAWAPAGR